MYHSSKLKQRSRRVLSCFCFIALSYVGISHAQQADKINKVKAAYIYNFTKYINFPEGRFGDATNNFNLCIKNAPEFVGLFESIEGVKIKNRDFRVIIIDDVTNLDECHFVYLQPGANVGIDEIISESLKGKFVTISSGPGFVSNGGMISFILVDNRVKVEINLESARQAGFTISARLLEISRVIK